MNLWKAALLGTIGGTLGGALFAVTIIYGAALTGNFPSYDDRHIHDYLISHPQLFAQMAERLQQQQDDADDKQRQGAIDKVGLRTFFDPKIAFVTGPENAKTTFVEFFDYNCPHCRNSVAAVQRFYNAHKSNARFAFIEFPIQGTQSIVAARAALAARRQPGKYIPFHFAMMNEEGLVNEGTVLDDAKKVGLDIGKLKADMEDPAISENVASTLKLAHSVHIDGTPEFIVNGRSREGEVDDALLNRLTKG
jgi:protein-disulfide isomerase